MVRNKAKAQFLAHQHTTDPIQLAKAFHNGQYVLSEVIALIQFHKYRSVNQRYNGGLP